MSEICSIKFDGIEAPKGGTITASWSKYHIINISFKCDIPMGTCKEKFMFYVDGKLRGFTNPIEIPGGITLPLISQPTCKSLQPVQLSYEIKPGRHIITIQVREQPADTVIDSYTFTVNIEKKENQTEPYSYPPPPPSPQLPQQITEFFTKNWWWLLPLSLGTVIVLTTKPKSEMEELMKLEKLKALKELGKQK